LQKFGKDAEYTAGSKRDGQRVWRGVQRPPDQHKHDAEGDDMPGR
jgi:hypothetical protein